MFAAVEGAADGNIMLARVWYYRWEGGGARRGVVLFEGEVNAGADILASETFGGARMETMTGGQI